MRDGLHPHKVEINLFSNHFSTNLQTFYCKSYQIKTTGKKEKLAV